MIESKESFKCEHCGETIGNVKCDYCYGDSTFNERVIAFARTHGLDTILAGVKVIEAMKENGDNVLMFGGGKGWCGYSSSRKAWVTLGFNGDNPNLSFDSADAAVTALLKPETE